MSYEFLPGVQVKTNDGGLVRNTPPRTKATLILGTAGKGVAEQVYQVTDRALVARDFGFDGTILRAVEELATGGCDNIRIFRMATAPAVASGIGRVEIEEDDERVVKSAADVGFTITPNERTADVLDRCRVFYSEGRLDVFFDGNLVYSNDPSNPVDTNEVLVEGTAIGGQDIKDITADVNATNYERSLSLSTVAGLTEVEDDDDFYVAPEVVAAELGLALTARETYEAQQRAFDILENTRVSQVLVPNAIFDNPSVAFYRAEDANSEHNPVTNENSLGWLRTFKDASGELQFHWANEILDSTGEVVSAASFVSAADRLNQGYHEVSFGYQLARFCAKQSENQGGCSGFIGTSAPKNLKPVGLRDWVGALPVKEGNTQRVLVPGRGLCGNPYLSGTTSGKLNPLCHDISTQSFRIEGLYQTASSEDGTVMGEYDEAIAFDTNGFPVDMGAYILVFSGNHFQSNGSGTYRGNISGLACGFMSQLDEKSALTNKPLPRLRLAYDLGLPQLNALTAGKVIEMRSKSDGRAPTVLHDRTVANSFSDYIFASRVRTKFLLTDALFVEADKFIGETTTDGLQLASLKMNLERRGADFVKRQYIGGIEIAIHSTEADRRIGRTFVDFVFNPPDQVVQIRATVAIGRV